MNEDTTQNENEQQGHLISSDVANGWGEQDIFTEPVLRNEQGEVTRGSDDEQEQEEVAADEDEDNLPEPEPYTPVITVEDPGEYTPADYSFDVTIYTGEEGKEKPKTIKVRSVDEAEQLLEQDPNFGSAKNLLDFNRKVTRMESKLEQDETEHNKRKEAYESESGTELQRQERINTVANELSYLEKKGKLPEVPAKYRNANWQDPEIAKNPAVKAQLDLIKYMTKENSDRTKLGLSPMGALDAYNAMKSEIVEQRAVDGKQRSAQERKQVGSRVAKGTPAPVGTAPKGISVGRGGNLRDISAGWGF